MLLDSETVPTGDRDEQIAARHRHARDAGMVTLLGWDGYG